MIKTPEENKPAFLLVANWDSNVGYAWWLMESYWARIAREFGGRYRIILAFPTISRIPEHLQTGDIEFVLFPFAQGWRCGIWPRAQFIRRHNIKLIYLTDHPSYSLAYLIYRCFGARWIITHDHSPGLRDVPKGSKKLVKRVLNRLSWLSADACIGATEYVRARLQNVNCVPAEKCFAAPNGILVRTVQADKQRARRQLGLVEHDPVVVTVARANKYKGIDFALDVFSHIAKAQPELKFSYLLVGDGPHLEEFKKRAEQLGLANQVLFPGRVEAVDDYLSAADIAFHPSLGEVGYCLAILEYMQAKLPVVVPDNPSVCGATDEHTGIIYPEFNVAAAAEALVVLMRQPQLRQTLGSAASQAVEQRFSLEKSQQALINVFDTIMR